MSQSFICIFSLAEVDLICLVHIMVTMMKESEKRLAAAASGANSKIIVGSELMCSCAQDSCVFLMQKFFYWVG